jgi:hypothetical protein
MGLATVSMTLFPFFEAIFMPAFAGQIDGPHAIIINAKAARFRGLVDVPQHARLQVGAPWGGLHRSRRTVDFPNVLALRGDPRQQPWGAVVRNANFVRIARRRRPR